MFNSIRFKSGRLKRFNIVIANELSPKLQKCTFFRELGTIKSAKLKIKIFSFFQSTVKENIWGIMVRQVEMKRNTFTRRNSEINRCVIYFLSIEILCYTVCPRSLDLFYIVNYYIKLVKTFGHTVLCFILYLFYCRYEILYTSITISHGITNFLRVTQSLSYGCYSRISTFYR